MHRVVRQAYGILEIKLCNFDYSDKKNEAIMTKRNVVERDKRDWTRLFGAWGNSKLLLRKDEILFIPKDRIS